MQQTIIQFGHGYMGNFHFDAATSAVRAMPSLDIVLVEPLERDDIRMVRILSL